jgi:hypothetical protein
MTDTFTQLNLGAGGDVMDEEAVQYGTAPNVRKRPRVVISGVGATDLVQVVSTTPDPTENGLIVRTIPGLSGTPFLSFSSVTLVPPLIESTVVTYTNPGPTNLYLLGFVSSGSAHGIYKMYVNSVPMLGGRTSPATLTLNLDFKMAMQIIAPGDTVLVTIIHYAQTGADFEGSILGYLSS